MASALSNASTLLVILEPGSDFKAPLARATRLARLLDASFYVFVGLFKKLDADLGYDGPDDLKQFVDDQENRIRGLLEGFDGLKFLKGIQLSWQSKVTDAVKHLLTQQPIDLIVKSPHEQTDFHTLFRNGVDKYFISECPLPVWMIKPKVWDENIEILACLDLADEGLENQQTNGRILATADHLASAMHADLHVVDCFFGELGTMTIDFNKQRGFRQVHHAKDQHLDKLKSYLKEYAVDDGAIHLEEGIPDDAIPETASRLKAELTIIGNNEDSHVIDKLFGDTAVQLARSMPCDILVLKKPR